MSAPDFAARRAEMVERQLALRGVRDARVLAAMRAAPRERFVPAGLEAFAYDDTPLPIEQGQTISQPYIVAKMIEAAEVSPGDRVLEIGAGSGYAAAVLGQIAAAVFAIERHRPLADRAAQRMAALGYANVDIRCGDGTRGLPERAPFDAILVAARSASVPQALRDQLAPGGRLIIPIGGDEEQTLRKITRVGDREFVTQDLEQVRFVPLISDSPADGTIGDASASLYEPQPIQRTPMTSHEPAVEVARDAAKDKAPDPRRHYDSPEALRDDDALDQDAKQALLTEWKQDLEQRIEAEAEGMSASDPMSAEKESRLAAELRKVSAALEAVASPHGGAT